MNSVQEIINLLKNNECSVQELEEYLESPLVLVKTNALMAIIRNRTDEQSIIQKLYCISKNIKHEPKVIGEWTTGHYAMAILKLLNTKKAIEVYNDNCNLMDEDTRESIDRLSEQVLYMLEEEKMNI